MMLRTGVIWFTLACFVATQTASVAGPHEEGVAAGQAANPVARGSITAPQATTVVPGYTAAPPESALYRKPNLAAQGEARLAACVNQPNDPVCQAQRGALTSANTARPAVTASDPAVAAARDIGRSPSSVLQDLASYYSGCTTTVTHVPPGTQTRSCLRYQDIGNYRCARSLTVDVERTPNCKPGDWIAHAGSGRSGLDVQCVPDRPTSAQHFRVTQDGAPLRFLDLDMTTPVVFPALLAVVDTSISPMGGMPIDVGLWVANNSCDGAVCSLVAMVTELVREDCTGSLDSGFSCTTVEPFLKIYSACRPGTQSGDNIQYSVCDGENGCTTTALDTTRCYAPAGDTGNFGGIDVTGTLPDTTWNLDALRVVVDWRTNPAYGPIAASPLNYDMPLMSTTTGDRWDDPCAALQAGGRCVADAAATCSDGPATKVIDGLAVTRPCWEFTSTLTCSSGAPADQCAPLLAAGCVPAMSRCRQTNLATGLCEVFEASYECPLPAQTITAASNCPANVFCLDGSCFDISAPKDGDFARSMSMLEAGREAGVYLDTDRMQVFRGEDNRCRDRLLKDCCYADGAGAGMTNQRLFGSGSRLVYDVLMNVENQQFLVQGMSALLTGAGFNGTFSSYGITVAVNGTALPAGSATLFAGDSIVVAFDPWSLAIAVVIYIALAMASCSEGEGRLAMKEGARLCRTIGTWCSSCIRVLGHCVACIEHTTSKCCFNSVLARVVNEQGRAQVGKGWGSGESPDCTGFTVAQLQRLDFAAMDLTEFYASLVPALPDVAKLQGNSASRVPTCYYGQGRCQ